MVSSDFSGLRVLIVEDESLIAMLIEDALRDLDCTTMTVASTFDDALSKASTLDFDIAILDVNLNGAPAYPIAETLMRRRIPFMFSTGYGAAGIPEAFRGVPVLAKPFKEGDVARALKTALTSS
jgi:CheY-like chemotaxis protein